MVISFLYCSEHFSFYFCSAFIKTILIFTFKTFCQPYHKQHFVQAFNLCKWQQSMKGILGYTNPDRHSVSLQSHATQYTAMHIHRATDVYALSTQKHTHALYVPLPVAINAYIDIHIDRQMTNPSKTCNPFINKLWLCSERSSSMKDKDIM